MPRSMTQEELRASGMLQQANVELAKAMREPCHGFVANLPNHRDSVQERRANTNGIGLAARPTMYRVA